ncbi:MAG TPA: universal stress protein [Verrucomicrobiae bacterium]|nr:universal stress protein [Verrucomicrobiae bacterium]
MKRILITTDLSPAADAAVQYGVKLAAALDAAVTLVAAYEEIPVPVADTASITFIDGAGIRDVIEQGLLRQQDLYRQDHAQPVQTLAVKGPVVGGILDTAAELEADMIIAGMKGQGRSIRKLLGSTVTTLARKTPVPLLVVPEGAGYTPPTHILLGNDIRPDTNIHALDPLRELVAVFNSKLYALRVISKGAKEVIEVIHRRSPLHDLDNSWDIKYEYDLGEDVVDTLNAFARSHGINLVALLPHHHSRPERWLIKSHTRDMIFEGWLPLLILPGQDR